MAKSKKDGKRSETVSAKSAETTLSSVDTGSGDEGSEVTYYDELEISPVAKEQSKSGKAKSGALSRIAGKVATVTSAATGAKRRPSQPAAKKPAAQALDLAVSVSAIRVFIALKAAVNESHDPAEGLDPTEANFWYFAKRAMPVGADDADIAEGFALFKSNPDYVPNGTVPVAQPKAQGLIEVEAPGWLLARETLEAKLASGDDVLACLAAGNDYQQAAKYDPDSVAEAFAVCVELFELHKHTVMSAAKAERSTMVRGDKARLDTKRMSMAMAKQKLNVMPVTHYDRANNEYVTSIGAVQATGVSKRASLAEAKRLYLISQK
jgi:hypothetical protein